MLLNLLGLKGLKEDGMEKGLLGKKKHSISRPVHQVPCNSDSYIFT